MSLKDQLEADIHLFFENIEKQDRQDKHKTLRILLEKYAHITTASCSLDKSDFDTVRNEAHRFYVDKSFPKFLGSKRREIHSTENNILAIIEGTIIMLNSHDCLKKIPKFDYRD